MIFAYFYNYNYFVLSIYFIVPLYSSFLLNAQEDKLFAIKYKHNLLYDYFFILLSLTSFFILYYYKIRGLLYYINISFLYVLIFIDVLKSRANKIFFSKLFFCSLNLMWGINLKYEYYFGNTDIFLHVDFIKNILSNCGLDNLNHFYSKFPLWHIFNSIFIKYTMVRLPIQKVMFIISGITYLFILYYTFKIVNIYFSKKVSMMSSLIVSLNDSYLFYGLYSISRSIIMLFLILFLFYLMKDNRDNIIILISIFCLVLYHPASVPFIILIYYPIFYVYKTIFKKINIVFLLILPILYIIYLYSYVDVIFNEIVIRFYEIGYIYLMKSQNFFIFDPYNELWNYMHYSIIIFLTLIGIKVYKKNEKYELILILILVLNLFFYPGPILLLDKLFSGLNFTRVKLYLIPISSILPAIGLKHILNKNRTYLLISLGLIFLLTFFSISNDFIATDNPLFVRQTYTGYFSKSDLISIEYVSIHSNELILSDESITRYLKTIANNRYETPIQISPTYKLNDVRKATYIVRVSELEKRNLKLYSSEIEEYKYNVSTINKYAYFSKKEDWYIELFKKPNIFCSKNINVFYSP